MMGSNGIITCDEIMMVNMGMIEHDGITISNGMIELDDGKQWDIGKQQDGVTRWLDEKLWDDQGDGMMG